MKLLVEFIKLNGGRLQIVSDAGYWCLAKDHSGAAPLKSPFPGTVVTIEIDTADTRSYALTSELTEADTF